MQWGTIPRFNRAVCDNFRLGGQPKTPDWGPRINKRHGVAAERGAFGFTKKRLTIIMMRNMIIFIIVG